MKRLSKGQKKRRKRRQLNKLGENMEQCLSRLGGEQDRNQAVIQEAEAMGKMMARAYLDELAKIAKGE